METEEGIRLFVVYRGNDHDGAALYWLSPDRGDTLQLRCGFANRRWTEEYPEASLRRVHQ